ncbi:MAG: aminotransferase class I/II-fold pyridoxal phosphate-dependent enzyme [Candidatus Zixiibacteriota bacterium]|nr:MAG: aminotransferase class I/II-fold pyridoxal phosphate-dependent enzyme [candidate division Zixibacteria bacterium]
MPKESDRIEQAPVVTPIVQSTTFTFPDTAALIDYQKGKRKGYIYTRYSNPTIEAVENRIAAMEGADGSLLFSSGMAAISSACMTFLKSGDEIVSSYPVYGGTAKLFDDLLKKYGIKIKYFQASDPEGPERMISSGTRILYLETPTNPNLQIIDLKRAARIARKRKIISIVDSTFATPINQKPLKFGIDMVIHSVTKFMGGHSDIMGGAVSSSEKHLRKIYDTRKLLGGCIDPHQAFLLDRGLRTLSIRMERHNLNALKIAGFLETVDKVKRVIYPGLDSHPQHKLAYEQLEGFGGMVSFDLGSRKRASKFADSLKVIQNAVSLGGVESLVSIPIWTSQYGLKKSDLDRSGVTPGLIRLSIGLEDPEELIGDIDQALKKAFRA